MQLVEQGLIVVFFDITIETIFNGLYLLKLCPNFVGSVQNLGDRHQKSI